MTLVSTLWRLSAPVELLDIDVRVSTWSISHSEPKSVNGTVPDAVTGGDMMVGIAIGELLSGSMFDTGETECG